MKRADLILFNEEIIRKMRKAGIRLDDYKYVNLYQDYIKLTKEGNRKKVVILTLVQKYDYTDRQVYNIIKHMEKEI